MKQFLSRNIHLTTARTGVMLFVSLAERYAEIIADSGINSRVSQDTWDGVVTALIAHAKQGRVADGFVEAVGTVGALLAQHFPVGAGDANELDDHVVEI
jgi:putative membrane protein